jgi:catechol 2,3-dioxygenase-like lactoylglutathione lyase family enzyme
MRAPFIDHVTLRVRDLAVSRAFYERALEPFGVRVVELDGEDGPEVSLGPEGCEDVGLAEGEPSAPVHIAFLAHDPETVDAFHAAALEAGGRDNGRPGRRPRYHERYYGAYVLDPDGNNVEAVCHAGPSGDERDPAGNPAPAPEDPR